MALTTKRAFFLFLSEGHLCRIERHLYFLPCQMHQKRTNKIVPFNYMKNGSLHKKIFCFGSFLNIIFLEKKVICTFCLAKCIRKGQTKIVPFDYMKNGSLHKKSICFGSFLNIIFLEKKVICTFCLAKCIRKGQKLFRLTTWRIALFTKKYFFFCSFLNIIFLEKKVICTFCLAKCIRKGQQNCSFWLHEEWLSSQKEHFFRSFLNIIFLEKVICTFCQMHQKRTTKLFLLTTWRMALSTKRAFFLVPFWMSSL